ncbi:RNA polymerase sigma factor [Dactylosporangium sp. NPDC051541]|uniref:RNA polymerase sigma factor n=1 Tax=Dactylosporangium sp. NPDC051541 TaxID=3363977 RepID=UPI0037A7D903
MDAYDSGDFPSFFTAQFGAVTLFLMRNGTDLTDAEDATQEAMCRARERWERIRHPGAWVRTVAIRIHADQAVREARERRHQEHAGREPSAAEITLFDDDERLVINLLRQLPERQRHVMAWIYDGYSIAEIAAIMDVSTSTIRSHLRHARSRLKQVLLSDSEVRQRWPLDELAGLAVEAPVNEPGPGEPAASPEQSAAHRADLLNGSDAEGATDLAERPPRPEPPPHRKPARERTDGGEDSQEGTSA